MIKTRLGIHDGVLENSSNEELIICEMVGKKVKYQEISPEIKYSKKCSRNIC